VCGHPPGANELDCPVQISGKQDYTGFFKMVMDGKKNDEKQQKDN
jgi:hypothetical protein